MTIGIRQPLKSDNRNKSTTNKIEKGLYNKRQVSNKQQVSNESQQQKQHSRAGGQNKSKKGKLGGQWPITPKEKTLRKKPLPHGEKNSGKNLTKKPAQTKMDTN